MTTRELITSHLPDLDRLDDPFVQAVVAFERAALLLDLEDWMVERLRHCERECTARLPLLREDGRAVTVTAQEAVHHTIHAYSIARLEVRPQGSQSEVRAHTMRMSWTCALMNVAASGGGVLLGCQAAEHSETEMRQLTRELAPALRARTTAGAITGGSGANDYVMAWLAQECAGAAVRVLPASEVERACQCEAATQWVMRMLQARMGRVEGARIALQGCGRKALDVAEALAGHGAKVIALADASGGVKDVEGLDLGAVRKHLAREGVLLGIEAGEAVSNAEVLAMECEALLLASGANQVTAGNGGLVRARVVAELEADAITLDAMQALAERTEVAPHWMMDAGTVVSATLQAKEWMGLQMPARRARAVIRRVVGETWTDIQQARRRWNVPVHEAAQLVAVDRLAEKLRFQRPG